MALAPSALASASAGFAPARVAAGVVVFRPERNALLELVHALRSETASVFVFLNGAIESDLESELRSLGAVLIASDHNLGVAEALNVLALAAILSGHRRLLLMDQDSVWPRGALQKLCAAMDAVCQAGHRAAVVGPIVRTPASGGYKSPRYFSVGDAPAVGNAAPVRYLITSGSLIDLDLFRAVGRFRSDFFMDAIDTEWCFRAWAHGFSCWVVRDVEMIHTIGTGTMGSRWLGPPIPRQRPFRLYAYVRNQTHCLRLPHVSLLWKARIAAHLARVALISAFAGRPEYAMSRVFLPAVRDGLAGQLGPPPGAEQAVALGVSRQ